MPAEQIYGFFNQQLQEIVTDQGRITWNPEKIKQNKTRWCKRYLRGVKISRNLGSAIGRRAQQTRLAAKIESVSAIRANLIASRTWTGGNGQCKVHRVDTSGWFAVALPVRVKKREFTAWNSRRRERDAGKKKIREETMDRTARYQLYWFS